MFINNNKHGVIVMIQIDLEKAQELYCELKSWARVAKLLKISQAGLYKKIKKAGLRTGEFRKENVDKNELEKLQSKYDSGMTLRELSKECNFSHNKLKDILKTRTISEAAVLARKKYPLSKETIEKLSRLAKERNLGGYRPHPNRGQKYKGIWFDSKWEVKVAKSLDKNGINWERPKVGFVWTDNGNKYYPDFFLNDFDVYLDPKNPYLQVKDKEKIHEAQIRNNIKVFVLSENELDWLIIKKIILG